MEPNTLVFTYTYTYLKNHSLALFVLQKRAVGMLFTTVAKENNGNGKCRVVKFKENRRIKTFFFALFPGLPESAFARISEINEGEKNVTV